MTKILFICHGNICRSPMAEYIMKDLLDKKGLSSEFYIDSAAVSKEELGNPIYPKARQILIEHGIRCGEHFARQVNKQDFEDFDYLICMDRYNIDRLKMMFDNDFGKVSLLMNYLGCKKDVADPWYTDDFKKAYDDIEKGCTGLLKTLTNGYNN